MHRSQVNQNPATLPLCDNCGARHYPSVRATKGTPAPAPGRLAHLWKARAETWTDRGLAHGGFYERAQLNGRLAFYGEQVYRGYRTGCHGIDAFVAGFHAEKEGR